RRASSARSPRNARATAACGSAPGSSPRCRSPWPWLLLLPASGRGPRRTVVRLHSEPGALVVHRLVSLGDPLGSEALGGPAALHRVDAGGAFDDGRHLVLV